MSLTTSLYLCEPVDPERSASNMEDGFGHSTYQSDELNEKADSLEGAADEFDEDSARDDAKEDLGEDATEEEIEQAVEEARDEWAEEVRSAISDAIEIASNF